MGFNRRRSGSLMMMRYQRLVNIIRNPDVTPSEGANLLADPGFEDWASATNLTDWVESTSGTSSVNQESSVVHSGDYAARADIDASGSAASILVALATTLYQWFHLRVWLKGSVGGNQRAQFGAANTGPGSIYAAQIVIPTTSYAQYHLTDYIQDASPTIFGFFRNSNNASRSLYWDDADLRIVTPGLALYNLHTNCGRFEMKFTREIGTMVGLIINADSDTNPQNYTRVLAGRTSPTTIAESVVLESVTAGVPATIASYSITYSPDAPLTVTRYQDGTLDIAYNGVALATGVAATGHAGTVWGAMNTFAGNSISELSADPRGCTMS